MRTLIVLVATLTLTGCGTMAGDRLVTKSVQALPDKGAKVVDALDKIANHGLLQLVARDVVDTNAWVDGQAARLGPIKTAQARMCPQMAGLAGQDLQAKLNALKAAVQAQQNASVSSAPGPEMILFFTQLKFGGSDPQASVDTLMSDVGARLDAVVQGCLPLFPTKQMNQLLTLVGEAGLTAYMPFAAPFVGAIGKLNPLSGLVGQ